MLFTPFGYVFTLEPAWAVYTFCTYKLFHLGRKRKEEQAGKKDDDTSSSFITLMVKKVLSLLYLHAEVVYTMCVFLHSSTGRPHSSSQPPFYDGHQNVFHLDMAQR